MVLLGSSTRAQFETQRFHFAGLNTKDTYLTEGTSGEIGDIVSVQGDWPNPGDPFYIELIDKTYVSPAMENETNIAYNASDISDNSGYISGNTTAIVGNDTDIADLQALALSTSSGLATSNQAIQKNAQAISSNTTAIGLNFKDIAESMAFGMIQQDVNHDGFQLSLGTTNYNGYSGFAFVGGAKILKSSFMNVGVTGSGNYAASVNFKW